MDLEEPAKDPQEQQKQIKQSFDDLFIAQQSLKERIGQTHRKIEKLKIFYEKFSKKWQIQSSSVTQKND